MNGYNFHAAADMRKFTKTTIMYLTLIYIQSVPNYGHHFWSGYLRLASTNISG